MKDRSSRHTISILSSCAAIVLLICFQFHRAVLLLVCIDETRRDFNITLITEERYPDENADGTTSLRLGRPDYIDASLFRSFQESATTGEDEQNRLSTQDMCGKPWLTYLQSMQLTNSQNSDVHELMWTVSGGPTYQKYIKTLLDQWKRLEPRPMLVVSLDQETADHVCALGYNAVLWDRPQQSYSRVADAKFLAAAEWASRGINALFVELDVFCRKSPFHLFQDAMDQSNSSLVGIAHYNANIMPNIGMYYVKGTNETAAFFASLSEVLKPSLAKQSVMYSPTQSIPKDFFDQFVFSKCLKKVSEDWVLKVGNTTFPELRILDPCEHVDRYAFVSNLRISSNHPPVVHESTYCVHPLQARPFVPLQDKLAVAKILGFDPVPIEAGERFIKTVSGEISYTDYWITHSFEEAFPPTHEKALKNIKYHFAAMVALAKASNRTLILPRHVRDGHGFAYPIFSMVDVSTIDELGVQWRYIDMREPSLIQFALRKVGDESDQKSVVRVVPRNFSATESKAIECNQQICEVHDLALLGWSSWDNRHHVDEVSAQLTWCLDSKILRIPKGFFGGFYDPCSKVQKASH